MDSFKPKVQNVLAVKWDGTRKQMQQIQQDLPLNFNDVSYDENGNVKEWLTGREPQLVSPGTYLVKDALGTITLYSADDFNILYEAV